MDLQEYQKIITLKTTKSYIKFCFHYLHIYFKITNFSDYDIIIRYFWGNENLLKLP